MKTSIMMVACGIAAMTSAFEMTPSGRPGLQAFRKPQHLAAAGGMVTKETPGNAFAFADCRKERTDLTELCEKIGQMARIKSIQVPCELKDTPLALAREMLKDSKKYGAIAVVYEGKADEPVLMTLPEDRIACLNLTPLRQGADATVFADRVGKELWRAFAFAAGGTCSGTRYCVMHPVLTPADLDAIECKTASPNVTGSVYDAAPKYGFARIKRSTYRLACREGWAPAPTNDVQKAIWERLHSEKERGPTNPIRILPPKK